MSKFITLVAAAALLAACKCDDKTPRQITTAPDGTVLWGVCDDTLGDARMVYFSRTGAQSTHSERRGKAHITVDDFVPNNGGQ